MVRRNNRIDIRRPVVIKAAVWAHEHPKMGIHRRRLAAVRAHQLCIAGVKQGLRGMGLQIADIAPHNLGAQPLPFPIPPMLEEAFSYRGGLRFVAFGYNSRTRRFCFCDGGDEIPVAHEPWFKFVRHPLLHSYLPENRYPTLYGRFTESVQPHRVDWLLLDREDREAYICGWDEVIKFFMLADALEGDHHTLFIDGFLMSHGCEDYKTPPNPETLESLRKCLDQEFERGS